MGQQQQRQSPPQIHRGVLDGIARLANPIHRRQRHMLIVTGHNLDRRSLQHLVDFLEKNKNNNNNNNNGQNGDDSHEEAIVITELPLLDIALSEPSDGGLIVLRDFFSRSDTALTKVTLSWSYFGTAEEASHLIAAFQTNRTVTDLTIRQISNLRGSALGNCLSGVLQHMPQLERLCCSWSALRVEGIRALQPALQANRTLRALNLSHSSIGNEGIRLIADSLVGNTTIEIFNIGYTGITSRGRDDITRILASTRLHKTDLATNKIFSDAASARDFARVLSGHAYLRELDISGCNLRDKGIHFIVDGLVGNTTMEALHLGDNGITSVELDDITRLLESTRLKTIGLWWNRALFKDVDATQQFVSTLQHKKSSVQELRGIENWFFQPIFPRDVDRQSAIFANINNSLKRNQQLNCLDSLLLAPPPPLQQAQQNHPHHGRAAAMTMFKTWHKAITKFAMAPNNAGASAIFKLVTSRPQLLEKRIKRQAAVATTAGVVSL
jgi:Ran GTPase-activating protein (RanGAP) involved in mRNA processing and transport